MRWRRAGSPAKIARRSLRLAPLLILLLPVMVSVVDGGGTVVAGATPTLNGGWAPFSRCPVDDPAMLAVDGRLANGMCIAADSASGSIKLGNTAASTGDSNVQFGVTGHWVPPFTVIPPAGGASVADPVAVPGGLLGLMCPSGDPVVASTCALITDNTINTVTASVQSAGTPADFALLAAIEGTPLLTLPIKIQLQNPLLGSNCYIGSDADPIVLHPVVTNTGSIRVSILMYATDGTPNRNGPVQVIQVTGANESDNSFAVPAASGCGLAGVLDGAINSRSGLPSPSGNNSIVLKDGTSYALSMMGSPNAGQRLSDAWHAAICATCSSGASTPPGSNSWGLSLQFSNSLSFGVSFR